MAFSAKMIAAMRKSVMRVRGLTGIRVMVEKLVTIRFDSVEQMRVTTPNDAAPARMSELEPGRNRRVHWSSLVRLLMVDSSKILSQRNRLGGP